MLMRSWIARSQVLRRVGLRGLPNVGSQQLK
jgi:hypothetical protein